MAWIVAAVFAALLVLFYSLYQRSITESRNLTNFALLILLDEGVCRAQRDGLAHLVSTVTATNAGELGAVVNLSVANLAARLGDTLLGTAGMLWALRVEIIKRGGAANNPSTGG